MRSLSDDIPCNKGEDGAITLEEGGEMTIGDWWTYYLTQLFFTLGFLGTIKYRKVADASTYL